MPNSELPPELGVTPDWVLQRTGIRERRIAALDETSATLGTHAAREALVNAGIPGEELDLILCATMTPDCLTPATACLIQAGLGLTKPVMAFDINSACSGFVFALSVAAQYLQTKTYQKILVIGTETMSRVVDYQDKNTSIIFGDGAGAAILVRETRPEHGILSHRMFADGNLSNLIHADCVKNRPPVSKSGSMVERIRSDFVTMNGREVFRFAVQRIVELANLSLADAGLSASQIDCVVPHQVNIRILEAAYKDLDLSLEKTILNLDRFGNTSGASVAIALDEGYRTGRIQPGHNVLVIAFGAGMSWSAMIWRV